MAPGDGAVLDEGGRGESGVEKENIKYRTRNVEGENFLLRI